MNHYLMLKTYHAISDVRLRMRIGMQPDIAAVFACNDYGLTPASRYPIIQAAIEAERACQNARVWIRDQRSKGKIRGKS